MNCYFDCLICYFQYNMNTIRLEKGPLVRDRAGYYSEGVDCIGRLQIKML